MNDVDWKRLLRQIRQGFIVPVIGPQLLVSADGSSLAARAADNLLEGYGLTSERELPSAFMPLGAAVGRIHREKKVSLQDLYTDVHDAIDLVTADTAANPPSAIRQIAEITDFQLLVTTTPDDLLARCLRRRCVVDEVLHAPKLPTSEWHDLSEDWRERTATAHLLYLFGKSSAAPVFAIHEEDILEYAHNIIARGSQAPMAFLGALQERSLLLIGCSFPDWLGRFFLRLTNKSRLSEKTKREWLIEAPYGDGSGFTTFVQAYSSATELLSDMAPTTFVNELHQRWTAGREVELLVGNAWHLNGPARAPALFFISYSRVTDSTSAEALYSALRGLGVEEAEIWFDREAIEPGENFRDRILDGVEGCHYFLPLLSIKGQEREEAFVYREWRKANERADGMTRDFIVPLVVDLDFEPERYKTVNPVRSWRDLDFGHAPKGCPDDRTRLRLSGLVRAARRGTR
jgi:TIR domain-containing protein